MPIRGYKKPSAGGTGSRAGSGGSGGSGAGTPARMPTPSVGRKDEELDLDRDLDVGIQQKSDIHHLISPAPSTTDSRSIATSSTPSSSPTETPAGSASSSPVRPPGLMSVKDRTAVQDRHRDEQDATITRREGRMRDDRMARGGTGGEAREEVYGLDGQVIGRHEKGVPVRKKLTDNAPRGRRTAVRGVPVPIPPPSLNFMRSLNGQLDSLHLNLVFPLPNPLPSLERWSKYLFTPKGQKKAQETSLLASEASDDEADEREKEDGFSLIEDLELDHGGRGEAENGSASKTYTRTCWTRAHLQGNDEQESPLLMEFHPDPLTALRVWDCAGVGNAGVQGGGDIKGSVVWENGPQEVFSWKAQRETWALDAALVGAAEGLRLVRLIMFKGHTGIDESTIRLERVNPYTDEVELERDCGQGRDGRILISNDRIVLTLAGKSPSISFLQAESFEPLCRSINEDVGVNTRSGLPVATLQGRLLAYVTMHSARSGVERYDRLEELKHGSIVTQRSVKAATEWKRQAIVETRLSRAGSSPVDERYSPESLPSMQAMMMTTAAGISSEVAKGVWSGLKGFGRAAVDGASRSEALSKSAPVVSEFAKRFSSDSAASPGHPKLQGQAAGSGGLGSGGLATTPRSRRHRGASWIKIIDLGRLVESRRPVASTLGHDKCRPSLVAHFALPLIENVSLPGNALPTIDIMAFSALGTRLAIGTSEGKIVSVVEIRMSAATARRLGSTDDCLGQVWLQHQLKRGVTPARISQIVWDQSGKTVGVTSRKTSHVFSIETAAVQLSLNNKASTATKIRTSDWVSTESKGLSPMIERVGASLLHFIPVSSDSASTAQFSVAIYDPTQNTLGKVSVFKLAVPPVERQEEILPVVTALWRLPRNLPEADVRREMKDTGPERKTARHTNGHPFSQVEVATFSALDVPPSIYKDRMFTFSAWPSGSHPYTLQFRRQVEVIDQGDPNHIRNALTHDLDVSLASPIIPALPNGSYGGDKTRWRVQPIRVVASAVKNRRHSHQKYRHEERQAEGNRDPEAGLLVHSEDQGMNHEESWEDDLVAGAMDD